MLYDGFILIDAVSSFLLGTGRYLSMQRLDRAWFCEHNKELTFGEYHLYRGGFGKHLSGSGAAFFGVEEEYVSMVDPIQRSSPVIGLFVLLIAGFWNAHGWIDGWETPSKKERGLWDRSMTMKD